MARIIKYQVTVWHKNGKAICRFNVLNLKEAKYAAFHNSKVYDVAHCIIKRLTSETTWVLKTAYYDLVGAFEEGIYYTKKEWQKMHPYLHTKGAK